MTKEYIEALLRAAAEAHHVYEAKLGHPDENWQGWYANHMADQIAADRAAIALGFGEAASGYGHRFAAHN